MTRSHDGRGPDGGPPENEPLQSEERGEPLGDAAFADAVNDDEDAPLLPLLDAEAGPARSLSERELLALEDRIERQFLAQRARPRSRLSPRRLLLAGGLFAASAAAAVYGVSVARRAAVHQTPQSPSVLEPPATEPSVTEPSVIDPSSSGPSVSGRKGAEPPPAPSAPEAQDPQVNPARAAAERPAEPQAPGAQKAAPKSSESSPSSAARSLRSGSNLNVAADRLAAANSLRSRHRYREALALYLQTIEMDPNGIQASVARVAAAEMKLEQFKDTAGAERLYLEARTQGGELTAEAQFGLAQVARARGDAPAEGRALQDFLARHPESPLAAAARRRLNTLGAR